MNGFSFEHFSIKMKNVLIFFFLLISKNMDIFLWK